MEEVKVEDEVVVENPEVVEMGAPAKVKWQPTPFYPAAGEDWPLAKRSGRFVRKPYQIDHEEGKPNETMIQTLMNFKSLDNNFKGKCIEMFSQSNWRYIRRRLLNKIGADDYNDALGVVAMLDDQIKRSKKYGKSLARGNA